MSLFRDFGAYCAAAAAHASSSTRITDVDVGRLSQFDAYRAEAARSAAPAARASNEFRHPNIMHS